jgi:hypothetical protein
MCYQWWWSVASRAGGRVPLPRNLCLTNLKTKFIKIRSLCLRAKKQKYIEYTVIVVSSVNKISFHV